jgi:hypothetical protein
VKRERPESLPVRQRALWSLAGALAWAPVAHAATLVFARVSAPLGDDPSAVVAMERSPFLERATVTAFVTVFVAVVLADVLGRRPAWRGALVRWGAAASLAATVGAWAAVR